MRTLAYYGGKSRYCETLHNSTQARDELVGLHNFTGRSHIRSVNDRPKHFPLGSAFLVHLHNYQSAKEYPGLCNSTMHILTRM
jgi:hypothetical protein